MELKDALNLHHAIIIFVLRKEGMKTSEIINHLQNVFGDCAELKRNVCRWIE